MAESASPKFRVWRRNGNQFKVKNKRGIRPDTPRRFTLFATSQFGGNKNLPLGTNFHARQSVTPPLHATAASNQVVVMFDELFSVHKRAAHFDVDHVMRGSEASSALFHIAVLEAVRQGL